MVSGRGRGNCDWVRRRTSTSSINTTTSDRGSSHSSAMDAKRAPTRFPDSENHLEKREWAFTSTSRWRGDGEKKNVKEGMGIQTKPQQRRAAPDGNAPPWRMDSFCASALHSVVLPAAGAGRSGARQNKPGKNNKKCQSIPKAFEPTRLCRAGRAAAPRGCMTPGWGPRRDSQTRGRPMRTAAVGS